MGQCYSVCLAAKVKDEAAFVWLSRSFIESQNIREDCFEGADMMTPDGNVKFMLAGNTQPEGYSVQDEPDGWREYDNAFDASYSWEALLYDWFRAVAPALESGSDIEVWPDSGSWRCEVGADGGMVETTTEEEEEE